MLVSHRKRFIYTKTEKTAGTSVESYFEQFCLPEGEWEYSEARDQYIGETGIIGQRGGDTRGKDFTEHMSAHTIRKKIGRKVWENYFKFTVVRNPFDKIVSYFHHLDHIFTRDAFVDLSLRRKIHRVIWSLENLGASGPVKRFRQWAQVERLLERLSAQRYPAFVNDRDRYVIDDEICLDHFIRTESLKDGIEDVCGILDVPYEPSRLPHIKSGRRPGRLDTAEYYNQDTAAIIAQRYAFELEMFDYGLPEK